MKAGGRSGTARLGIVIALLAASLAGLSYGPDRASAATVVCGTLTGSTTWTAAGNPFYVTCDVTVEQGASLTVQAGVTVLVSPGSHFWVDGALLVSGTVSQPVVFESNATMPAPNDWGGLILQRANYGQITGLVVRHANVALMIGIGPAGQGVLVQDSEFAFSEFGLILGGGPFGTGGPVLRRVHVHDNGQGIHANSTLYVADSTIQANLRQGIHAGVGPLYLTNSTVSLNGVVGIELWALSPYQRSILTCNDIEANDVGVDIIATQPNAADADVAAVFWNNFANNAVQARDTTASSWDNGTAGNFWSDYTGTDADGDGFGDTPYVIDADSRDSHPWIGPPDVCPGTGGGADDPPAAPTARDAQLTGTGLGDVTLTWSPSPDDGAGENDLAGYLLYESTTFAPDGTGYALLVTLPPGTTTYVHTAAGSGDPANHFYRLVAKDAAGQATASPDQFVKYARTLTAGPHLLSIPVRMSDTGIDTVLRGVDYEVARTYVNPAGYGKNWLTRARDKPWGDLTNMDETIALWLVVRTDSELIVAGILPSSVTIHLEVGWNFVGYPSFVDRTVGEALADANVQTVEGFDPGNSPFYLRRLAPTDVMHAGDGFWVHVSGGFDWTLGN